MKPQYVDQIPRAVKGSVRKVGDLIKGRAQMDNMEHVMNVLGMWLLSDLSFRANCCRTEPGCGP